MTALWHSATLLQPPPPWQTSPTSALSSVTAIRPPRPAPPVQCFIHVLWRVSNQHMVPFVLPSSISVQLGATVAIYQRFW